MAFELARAIRAPDTLKIRILPAVLLVPTLSLLTMLAITLTDSRRVVALPEQGGPERSLVEAALAEEDLSARFVADPGAALARGEVDGAVRWEAGGASPLRAWDEAGDARWVAIIQTRDEKTEDHLWDALVDVGDAMMDAEVGLAGGDPGDVAVTDIDEIETEESALKGITKIAPTNGDGYWVLSFTFLGVYSLMFSLPVAGLQDRQQGIAEALAVLPVPALTLHGARLLSWCAVAALACAVLMSEVLVFMGDLIRPPSPGAVLAGLGALLMSAAMMQSVGIACRSPVTAMNLGPGAGLAVLGLMVLGTHVPTPGWVPVLGLMSKDGAGAMGLAGLISMGLAAGLVALGARVERDRIEEGR